MLTFSVQHLAASGVQRFVAQTCLSAITGEFASRFARLRGDVDRFCNNEK
jgi:hypothetical protein